jgi:hypothetical protein
MMGEGDAAEAFLRGRPRPLALAVPLSPDDVPDGLSQLPREGYPVVHVVFRWRRSGVEARPGGRRVSCEYPPGLDSIHVTAESAREREAALHREYETMIETIEVYTTGVDVAPWEADGAPVESPAD